LVGDFAGGSGDQAGARVPLLDIAAGSNVVDVDVLALDA